ncbi:MAG: hypothetical protein H6589_09280 [Flavobacteriales bacterium]|nr:hypothetical protein [Flavobacteriales bacterium]
MNQKGIIHIILFLFITLGLHVLLGILNWPGKHTVLILIPFLFGFYHLIKCIIYIAKSEYKTAIYSIIISLLFILITLKISYVYYNVLINIFLIISGVISYLNPVKNDVGEKIKTTSIFLIIINFGLLLTPDSTILKYFNDNNRTWTPNITWEFFKGKPDNNSPYSALISTDYRWKTNKLFNYPPAILLAVVIPDSSWKKSSNTIYDYLLLEHEQGHFNLKEAFKREAVDSINREWGEGPEKIEKILEYFFKMESVFQQQYDSMTIHGSDTIAQRKWNTIIEIKMNK